MSIINASKRLAKIFKANMITANATYAFCDVNDPSRLPCVVNDALTRTLKTNVMSDITCDDGNVVVFKWRGYAILSVNQADGKFVLTPSDVAKAWNNTLATLL